MRASGSMTADRTSRRSRRPTEAQPFDRPNAPRTASRSALALPGHAPCPREQGHRPLLVQARRQRARAQRESHAFLDDSPLPLEREPDGRCRWWTFGGGAGNRVLAGLLEPEPGERVSPGNTFITFSNGAAESAVAIRQAIDLLAARELTWDDPARLVDPGRRSRDSKFQPCLPPEIEHALVARETMNVEDANATLAQWARAPNQEVEA